MLKRSKLILCTLALAVGLTGFAIPAGAAVTAPTSAKATHFSMGYSMHGGHAMEMLAEITGKSMANLSSQYPQKTAWQIAKAMGKLPDLKKAYLARGKVMIDNLVENKSISADDGAKMYADMQKRVAAIDGVNIVIAGKPGFTPQFPSHR